MKYLFLSQIIQPSQGSGFFASGCRPLFGVCVYLSVTHLKCSAGFITGTDWKAVNEEPFLSTRYTVQNLSSGDKIHIRVKAISASGASVPATLDQPVVIREILREYRSCRVIPICFVSSTEKSQSVPEQPLSSHTCQSSLWPRRYSQ